LDHNGRREAELARQQGELLLARGMVEAEVEVKAESRFRRALAIARQQGATSVELLVAISLGHEWQKQGRRAGACELLAAI